MASMHIEYLNIYTIQQNIGRAAEGKNTALLL